MKTNINTRATIKSVNDIQADLHKMATKEDFKLVKEKIEKFDFDLTNFKNQNDTFTKILRGYDEVLSQKASKINLLDLEEKTRISLKRVDVVGVIENKMISL